MEKQNENKKAWAIEIGMYPGVLFGVRTYKQEDRSIESTLRL
jgi:hypothetical protein